MSDLKIRNLEVRYGDLVGVADVSLEVRAGSVVALLGSNGAGNPTTTPQRHRRPRAEKRRGTSKMGR